MTPTPRATAREEAMLERARAWLNVPAEAWPPTNDGREVTANAPVMAKFARSEVARALEEVAYWCATSTMPLEHSDTVQNIVDVLRARAAAVRGEG